VGNFFPFGGLTLWVVAPPGAPPFMWVEASLFSSPFIYLVKRGVFLRFALREGAPGIARGKTVTLGLHPPLIYLVIEGDIRRGKKVPL
jgi:hypothetical protein